MERGINRIQDLKLYIGNGEFRSFQAYSKINTSPVQKKKLPELLSGKNFWQDDRSAYHKKIIESYTNSVRNLSELLQKSSVKDLGIILVRGPIASGKSTFIKDFIGKEIGIDYNLDGIINTDFVKNLLAKNFINIYGKKIPTYIFHDEASFIVRKVIKNALSEKLLFVLDNRFASIHDFEIIFRTLKGQNRYVTVFDIEGQFITSAMRILDRTGVYPGMPAPTFSILLKDYQKNISGRESILSALSTSNVIKNMYSVRQSLVSGYDHISLKCNFKINKKNIQSRMLSGKRDYTSHANILLSSGESLKTALDKHAEEIVSYTGENVDYYENFMKNIEMTSRSFHGELNTAASKRKVSKMATSLSSEQVKVITQKNLAQAFNYISQNKNIPLISPGVLNNFILDVAYKINYHLILKDRDLLRVKLDKVKFNYLNSEKVLGFYSNFVDSFYKKICNADSDPVDVAAWIEWNIDFTGHIFSDGCGRIAKTLSTWYLMRVNIELPDYSLGLDFHKSVRGSYRKRFAPRNPVLSAKPVDGLDFQHFLRYYRRLFKRKRKNLKIMASGGIILDKKGRILTLQIPYGKDEGKSLFPGGKMEFEETPIEAFKREAMEETGLKVIGVKSLIIRFFMI